MLKILRMVLFFLVPILFVSKGLANEPVNQNIREQVKNYIYKNWDVLTRHNTNIGLSRIDPKIPSNDLYIYLPRGESLDKVTHEITGNLLPNQKEKIKIRYLPADVSKITDHGLLYLPNPYVVPGGRFNEMYAWDSFFIGLGLFQLNRAHLVKGMIDNFIYEINHYGTILNANRTYDIERSQPPLLTEMILTCYENTKDKAWLASTLPAVKKLYKFWMTPPHLVPEVGLSRYYAGGQGPAPEESPIYYQRVIEYFKKNVVRDYDKNLYFDSIKNTLTPLFYVADRTVRESGLDISAKYGPFGMAILDYIPVDLNVFLYQFEKDVSTIYKILNRNDLAAKWDQRAKKRAGLINTYLWEDSLGYYFDYNFRTRQLRPYVYATTFYPLWAGIASKEQAEQLVGNLPNLLGRGGVVTSTYRPRSQWDAPFGWAPIQYFVVFGLSRYGYDELAKEVAERFLKTVDIGFEKTHLLFEKYDVQHLSTVTENKIDYGYDTNEIGFGWTNGVYLEFLDYLKQKNGSLKSNSSG